MRVERVLVPILILQVISVFFLWTFNSVSEASLKVFTLFLAVDLMGFVLVAQFYRSTREGHAEGKGWIILASLAIVALLISSLLVS